MRELPGVNDIGRPDTACNRQVKNAIDVEKMKLPTNEYIAALREGLTVSQIKNMKKKKEYEVIETKEKEYIKNERIEDEIGIEKEKEEEER